MKYTIRDFGLSKQEESLVMDALKEKQLTSETFYSPEIWDDIRIVLEDLRVFKGLDADYKNNELGSCIDAITWKIWSKIKPYV